MSTDPSFNHNYALYLAAGYQNDVAAVKHALVDGKLLNLTTTTSCGYMKVDEKIWPKEYTPDWRPYERRPLDGFAASHQAALRGFKDVLEILFSHGQFTARALDGRGKTPKDYAYEGGYDSISGWIDQIDKIQRQTKIVNKWIRREIKKKDLTLQDYLLQIGYIRKHKSGKIITGNSLRAIHHVWNERLGKKIQDLLINEKEFVVIIEKISIEVDGLKLDLPLSEDALRRIRRKKRARR